MATPTQYVTGKEKVAIVKKFISDQSVVGMDEFVAMSENERARHFMRAELRGSMVHDILIELPMTGIQRMKHESRMDYNTKTVKRVAKRYRMPGRC